MAKRVSVRRARLEQQKAQRNLILSILLAVVIGVVFLFVAMPLIFQFAIDFARSNDTGLTFTDTIPPQRPAFQPPEEYVNKSELELSGYTEANAEVRLIISGQTFATTTADENGEFSFKENLTEGEYTLLVEAADEAGNVNASAEHPINVDLTKPTLSINTPEDGKVFTLRSEKVVKIEGILSEPGTVYVNGSFSLTDEEGVFTSSLSLSEGENEIKISGEDLAGNKSDEKVITVRYEP